MFLDPEGRYILWNQRYAEIYHRSADLFAPGRRLADTLASAWRAATILTPSAARTPGSPSALR